MDTSTSSFFFVRLANVSQQVGDAIKGVLRNTDSLTYTSEIVSYWAVAALR